MKKLMYLVLILVLAGCASKNTLGTKKPIFETLTTQGDGGANIRFYEILSEPKEIMMLLSDPNLKRKIKQEDIQNSNFIILNMGEKPSGGYKIEVENVEETATNIVVTVKEILPAPSDSNISVLLSPYTIVKINSKKPIIIK